MYEQICRNNRESIYGVLCQSPIRNNQINLGNGTAFMIAPGICATAAHVIHIEADKLKPLHKKIEVIRTPDIGTPMLTATLLAEDINRDLALIQITNPTNNTFLTMNSNRIGIGNTCGALGFPLAKAGAVNNRISFNLVERFQGAHISAFQTVNFPNNVHLDFYETDSLMYEGSSGCPGFDENGNVFGMHVATVREGTQGNMASRLAISLWVPSMDIIAFANNNGVNNINVV